MVTEISKNHQIFIIKHVQKTPISQLRGWHFLILGSTCENSKMALSKSPTRMPTREGVGIQNFNPYTALSFFYSPTSPTFTLKVLIY